MDLWSMAGGLALARMRPILEVAGSSHLSEIDAIIAACGTPGERGIEEEITVLRSWRNQMGALEDSSTPTYFQSTAAGVAILVAAENLPYGDREWRIRSGVGNFWDSCDDLVHAGGGYSRVEFQGIKTTLRGVEDIWCNGDIRLLSDERTDDAEVYTDRLARIRSNYLKRRQIARVVAECAGWNVSSASP